MKKILFFLMAVTIAVICCPKVDAATSFYEGEYIDNIYMNKKKRNSDTIYYQKARFFRQTGTNDFAYCIDPFVFFQEGSTYEETINPKNLSAEQKENISLIAYFGYQYPGHSDPKWYAITQLMIWQEADPTGDFYFTNGLNGNRIQKFTTEINAIKTLVNNYKKTPTIANQNYFVLENTNFVAADNNNVLPYYKSTSDLFYVDGNKIRNKQALEEGEYTIELVREEKNHHKPIIFYQSNNSQSLMETGDLQDKKIKLSLRVLRTEIKIEKLDKDSDSTESSGEASLIGAVFGVYDKNNNEVARITIDESYTGKVTNLPLGTYYIKEITAPPGYQLNNEVYEVTLTDKDYKISIPIINEVIKKKVIIYKTYDENKKIPEANISFFIYDKDGNKVATITTDENGKAEITLPYGEYTIKQDNTTDGYHKVEDIKVSVTDTEDEIITLTDYKIKVPNTNTNIILTILEFLINLLNL